MLSADRRRRPVYAFSDTGHLNISDTASNHAFKDYMSTISSASLKPFNPKDSLIFTGTRWNVIVSPLLEQHVRRWDQYSLNKYVKNKNGCTDAPVGCVALAMSQIMSYYSCPTSWPLFNVTSSERYVFDWNIIRTRLIDDQLARLLEILGREENLWIQYSDSGSGAYNTFISPTFKKMGYQQCSEALFSTSLAVDNLTNVGPILVGADSRRHAWTIDGVCRLELDQPDPMSLGYYFHFVWGHCGDGNGYYYFDSDSDEFSTTPSYQDESDPLNTSLGSGSCVNVKMWYNIKKQLMGL